MHAIDVMTSETISADENATVPAVARLLAERGISAVPVVDKDDRVTGMVSARARYSRLSTATGWNEATAEDATCGTGMRGSARGTRFRPGNSPSCFCREPHGLLNYRENPYSSHAAIQPKDTSACWSYRVLLKAHDRSVLIGIIRHAAEGEHPRRQSGSMGVAGRTVDLSQFARRRTRSTCRRAIQPPNLGSSFDEAPVSPCRSFFLDSLQDRRRSAPTIRFFGSAMPSSAGQRIAARSAAIRSRRTLGP